MSVPIEELKTIKQIGVKNHTAIFDLYVVLGRDLEQIAIKFGYDIPVICTVLKAYGEKIDPEAEGRLPKVSRLLVEEYIEHFFPGIPEGKPEDDWITFERYLDAYHPAWRGQIHSKNATPKKKKKNRGLY
ncbi:MAG: hypothetical protein RSD88_07605 [Anaerovoracaceae bacterium]